MYLEFPWAPSADITGDLSLFYVANFTDFIGQRTICSETSGALPYQFDYKVTAAGATFSHGNGGFFPAVTSRPLPAGQYLVGGVTVLGGGVYHYLNNAPNGTGTLDFPAQDLGLPMHIGMRDDHQNPFVGNLGDILLYNSALSGSDLELVNSYLAARYGIVIAKPSTQPPSLRSLMIGASTLQLSWDAGYAH